MSFGGVDITVCAGIPFNAKENKATATLGKRNSSSIYTPGDFDFDFDMGPNSNFNRVFSYGGRPRLGIKAQDTEDGKGVKVIDVDEGSAADKSGIKENDIITEFEGQAVNSAGTTINSNI